MAAFWVPTPAVQGPLMSVWNIENLDADENEGKF